MFAERILHARTFTAPGPNGLGSIAAEAKFSDYGSQDPRFSLTCGTGADHDRILAAMPGLQIFADLHLRDRLGYPLHAVDNGLFHIEARDVKAVMRHFLVDESGARAIIDRTTWKQHDIQQDFLNSPEIREARNTWLAFKRQLPRPLGDVQKAGFPAHSISRREYILSLLESAPPIQVLNYMFGDPRAHEALLRVRKNPSVDIFKQYVDLLDLAFDNPKIVEAFVRRQLKVWLSKVIDEEFAPAWKRIADLGIEKLTLPPAPDDEPDEYDATAPAVRLKGSTVVVCKVHTGGYLPLVDLYGSEYYVAVNALQAGEAARKYWKDLMDDDPNEFVEMVGENTILDWARGRLAGPGSTKVRNAHEWLDLWLKTPEEEFASYDGKEVSGEINRALATKLDWELDQFPDSEWLPVVFYRHS